MKAYKILGIFLHFASILMVIQENLRGTYVETVSWYTLMYTGVRQ